MGLIAGNPDLKIEEYRRNGNQVDVYSNPNRYPNLFRAIRNKIPKGGVLVELGAAAGDNLVALKDHFAEVIGIDELDMQTMKNHPMMAMRDSAVASRKTKKLSLWQSNMFSEEFGNFEYFRHKHHPLVFMALHSIFPHYDVPAIYNFLHNILFAEPDYLIIGGGYPGIEQIHPDNQTHWTSQATARIYRYDTRPRGVFQPEIKLVDYVTGRNAQELEKWLSSRGKK